jgi:hypothetical protein
MSPSRSGSAGAVARVRRGRPQHHGPADGRGSPGREPVRGADWPALHPKARGRVSGALTPELSCGRRLNMGYPFTGREYERAFIWMRPLLARQLQRLVSARMNDGWYRSPDDGCPITAPRVLRSDRRTGMAPYPMTRARSQSISAAALARHALPLRHGPADNDAGSAFEASRREPKVGPALPTARLGLRRANAN